MCAIDELSVPDYITFELICEFIKKIVIKALENQSERRETNMINECACKVVRQNIERLIRKLVQCVYFTKNEDNIWGLCEIFVVVSELNRDLVKSLVLKFMEIEFPKMAKEIKENFITEFFSLDKTVEKWRCLKSFYNMCQINFINKS